MILKPALIMTMLIFCFVSSNASAAGLTDEGQIASVEERRILVAIEEELSRLKERENKIADREMQLKTLTQEVDKRLAAIQQLRDELVGLLERKEETENERIAELSRIYERMKPQNAAVLIEALDYNLAVDLLLGMKKKTAGKILDNLDAATATKLSNTFAEIR